MNRLEQAKHGNGWAVARPTFERTAEIGGVVKTNRLGRLLLFYPPRKADGVALTPIELLIAGVMLLKFRFVAALIK